MTNAALKELRELAEAMSQALERLDGPPQPPFVPATREEAQRIVNTRTPHSGIACYNSKSVYVAESYIRLLDAVRAWREDCPTGVVRSLNTWSQEAQALCRAAGITE